MHSCTVLSGSERVGGCIVSLPALFSYHQVVSHPLPALRMSNKEPKDWWWGHSDTHPDFEKKLPAAYANEKEGRPKVMCGACKIKKTIDEQQKEQRRGLRLNDRKRPDPLKMYEGIRVRQPSWACKILRCMSSFVSRSGWIWHNPKIPNRCCPSNVGISGESSKRVNLEREQ
ncbi:uncharacterized protein F5147DRAFT_763876 [Suillus discolor]|uniref:Uncharacterized protein n=1 Tax=Suillus discolor TaxID=1912936 RepID=A0A9P7JPC4_9AGAM|nr:uncharacterized protein F5147DRAFT_763876 [Suillus discolor]KAG2094443.1 hypothetical protein F5147DRAFT_763876 [Suillus discolor]